MSRLFWSEVKLDVVANHKSKRYSFAHFIATVCFSTGFQLLLLYRMQRFLINIPFVGKVLTKFLHIFTMWLISCDVSYRAEIAGGVFLPHAIGIVIGKGAVIESGVTIYQGVTIGLIEDEKEKAAHIESGAIIYAGAKILGDITVGKNAKVGANAVVLASVPAQVTAVGIPARIIRSS
jgi:serine O-acetyltransferase